MAGPGKRQYVVKGTTFEVDVRYEVRKGVGQGAYGLICAAKDTKDGDQVAIKKITNAFEHHTFAKRTLREITLMRMMQHENVRFPVPLRVSFWWCAVLFCPCVINVVANFVFVAYLSHPARCTHTPHYRVVLLPTTDNTSQNYLAAVGSQHF